MRSLHVVFTGPEAVEVREETVADPGPGEVLCRAERSLISIGTETRCLRGVFDTGTNWADWVLADSLSVLAIHALMRPEVMTEFNPWTAEEMASLFFDYLRQNRMRVGDLVTHRHPPSDAPAVYGTLLRDPAAAIGVVFDWTAV